MVSFISLCVLLGVGHLLRSKVRLLRKLYLPSCVIGGLVGLTVLSVASAIGYPIVPEVTEGWSSLPSFLINIVFACLFLGVALPKLSTLWRRAAPQLAYGQVVAWGQYVVGVGLVLVLLTPLFGVPDVFGGLIPVGFEGGHGTAGGLKDTFVELSTSTEREQAVEGGADAAGIEAATKAGRAKGKDLADLAVAAATAGIISAIIVGMILVNWAARKGYTHKRLNPEDVAEDDSIGVIPVDRRPEAGKLVVTADAIESFTLHIVIVGVACFFGWLLKEGLWLIEGSVNAGVTETARKSSTIYRMIKPFPLFPLCMLGGLVVQIIEDKFDRYKLIDLGLMRRIQNTALDFLVVAAIAMIGMKAVVLNFAPFAIIIAAAILWNVFCVVVLARRMLPDAWFERAIAELGQSMGVTATGLLLLRTVDPEYESPAADAFASKQLLHEPFMGGGLWTSTAIPMLYIYGGLRVLLIAVSAMAAWFVFIFFMRRMSRT